jgi:DNA-binding NtrC family response regulator
MGATILVVEDNDGIAQLLRHSLTDDGVLTVHANDGAYALQMLDQGCRPDLLLLDLRLPDMDAGALVAEARARGFHIPALLISGWPNAAAMAEEYGLPFLEKPFDLDELADMLSALLSAESSAAQPALTTRSGGLAEVDKIRTDTPTIG